MKCPGQDSRYWTPEAIFQVPCPKCGNPLEFFKDEATRRCRKCGNKAVNPRMDFGCASYCKYAEQCLGDLPPELLAKRNELLKDRVAIEMKRFFNRDFKRIGHATKVARYAEQIAREEKGDPAIAISAAYLHDIGVREAEAKYGSTEPRYQEELGPPVAREILTRLGANPGLIEEVCDIIGRHHHPRPEETMNFKAVYDGDVIVNMEERKDPGRVPEQIASMIENELMTETGRRIAKKILFTAEDAESAEKSISLRQETAKHHA